MIRRSLVVTLILAAMTVGLFPVSVGAQAPTNKGLFISPPRNFVEVDAGASANAEVTVTNLTESPLVVTMLIEEFTVSDYSYEYIFTQPKEDWIKFTENVVQLDPGKNEKIPYTVTPPPNTTPGGKYYTIVAQATIQNGSVSSKVQVAAPLYITVNGQTTRTNKLVGHSISRFTLTRGGIPFTLDIKNTGNIHYIATVEGSLSGLFTDKSTVSATHILLPDSTRRVTEEIPTPLLPGIYKATYGYKTDSTGDVKIDEYIIYTPLWFYIATALTGWGIVIFVRRHKTKRPNAPPTDSQPQPYTSPK